MTIPRSGGLFVTVQKSVVFYLRRACGAPESNFAARF